MTKSTSFKRLDLLAALLVALLMLLSVFPADSSAHPFGGILQKTVISDLGNTFMLEYTTHFGQEQVLLQNPDLNGDGRLDGVEQETFLQKAAEQLTPNISCSLDGAELAKIEVDRKVLLEDGNDYKNGMSTTLTFHLALGRERSQGGLLKISDNNFTAGEMNRLNYFVTVLGRTAPMTLGGDGRELLIDLAQGQGGGAWLPGDDAQLHHPVTMEAISGGKNGHEDEEASSLLGFLKQKDNSVGLYLLGFLTAFVLGAFHALSPGHGKAMVAAYLVGTRGRVSDAVRLGIVVTITHIFSVLVLGVVALVLSKYSLSKNFYPWLGLASGVLIIFTGYIMLARTALFGNSSSHDHSDSHHHHDVHDHDSGHSHDHEHSHNHGSHGHSHTPQGNSLGEILSLGIAGGLVPCPSAIVILLFAIAVNRIAAGLMLIVSFSLGLAGVLIAIGILMVKASDRMARAGQRVAWIRKLPVLTAGLIMLLGLGVGVKALIDGGILIFHL